MGRRKTWHYKINAARKREAEERASLEARIEQEIEGARLLENRGRLIFLSSLTLQRGLAALYMMNEYHKSEQKSFDYLSHNYGFLGMIITFGIMNYFQIQMRAYLKKEGEIKSDSAWSIIRHPIYLAYRVASISTFAAGPSLLNALAGVGAFIGTEISARAEEQKLEARFGDQYRDYATRVPRWIPRLRYKQ